MSVDTERQRHRRERDRVVAQVGAQPRGEVREARLGRAVGHQSRAARRPPPSTTGSPPGRGRARASRAARSRHRCIGASRFSVTTWSISSSVRSTNQPTPDDPGVVDQHVDRSDALDQRGQRRQVGEVARERLCRRCAARPRPAAATAARPGRGRRPGRRRRRPARRRCRVTHPSAGAAGPAAARRQRPGRLEGRLSSARSRSTGRARDGSPSEASSLRDRVRCRARAPRRRRPGHRADPCPTA